jgi:hypothetical protein
MATEHEPLSRPVGRAQPEVVPGAVCDGTSGGGEAQVGDKPRPRSPGSLVVSPNELYGHQWFLGVAVRPV